MGTAKKPDSWEAGGATLQPCSSPARPPPLRPQPHQQPVVLHDVQRARGAAVVREDAQLLQRAVVNDGHLRQGEAGEAEGGDTRPQWARVGGAQVLSPLGPRLTGQDATAAHQAHGAPRNQCSRSARFEPAGMPWVRCRAASPARRRGRRTSVEKATWRRMARRFLMSAVGSRWMPSHTPLMNTCAPKRRQERVRGGLPPSRGVRPYGADAAAWLLGAAGPCAAPRSPPSRHARLQAPSPVSPQASAYASQHRSGAARAPLWRPRCPRA
jgi:hypothetical protein